VLIAGGTVVLCLLISAPCAYACRSSGPLVGIGLLAILVSQMIPGS